MGRRKSEYNLSEISIEEANVLVVQQDLQKQIRYLYHLVDINAEEEEIKAQEYYVKNTELVLQRLEELIQ